MPKNEIRYYLGRRMAERETYKKSFLNHKIEYLRQNGGAIYLLSSHQNTSRYIFLRTRINFVFYYAHLILFHFYLREAGGQFTNVGGKKKKNTKKSLRKYY